MSLSRIFIVLFLALAAACSNKVNAPVSAVPNNAVLPGVYAGIFPCDGCEGIEATLWLRADGRFFFRQRYPSDDAHEARTAYSYGRWEPLVDEAAIELRGEGPLRTFESPDAKTLLMRTYSELEHRLTRQSTATDFGEIIRVRGVMQLQGDGASFTECLTGYVVPVSQRGEFPRFRHQYRSAVVSGKPAFVEFDGRYSWSADHAPQSLTIEKFVTVKADGGC
ncbi:MAG: copper resistance protein NlpE N-terminal domain-containing protein [Gammaproteobacteria bacterium]|nr:copper resistance protein NlpE N-terminal domain-containing protein [Gammaproteobacteria bacterium]MDH5305305.1 copper resistance protein NlpE N-terminal domain-containing protein [Gammaproteobacteria bacterium]MDH5323786.1 copper resistance protein NlpE N-terminal domain-containing protein [Gammaproteobacteria bacterium]